ncbi:trigger factor [Candidatus Uhrbacteria bacterium]|nr:trigger factor [Candidatus Uhrbacteria bacterium]
MPDIKTEMLEKNQIKLTFTITQEEAWPYLEEAAKRLSVQTQIPGFRPGHAGYEIVKARMGEMKILEEALEPLVRKSYVEAILSQRLDTVGSPKIDVEKLAPGNDIVFTAVVVRMPEVTALADFRKLSVAARASEIKDSEIDLALKDLTRMQTKEVRAAAGEAVTLQDKIVVAMNMKLDGVPVEGGQSGNHAIYLTEDYYIPGLKEQVVGMKEGEEKTFTLPFPTEHVQKMLAGRDVVFEIVLKELYHLLPPTLDDAFAVSLGTKSLASMRELIHKNLLDEKIREARTAEEKELLELLANKSQFENIPDLLLNEEINKMVGELKRAVESQGADFDSYVQNLKKTLAELKLDFTPQALIRIKVALVLRCVAKEENVEVKDSELDEELDRVASQYEDKETKERVYSPEYRDYMEQILRNRKTIDLLRGAMVR